MSRQSLSRNRAGLRPSADTVTSAPRVTMTVSCPLKRCMEGSWKELQGGRVPVRYSYEPARSLHLYIDSADCLLRCGSDRTERKDSGPSESACRPCREYLSSGRGVSERIVAVCGIKFCRFAENIYICNPFQGKHMVLWPSG